MTYAVVHEVPASWDHYETLGRELRDPVPTGLVVHDHRRGCGQGPSVMILRRADLPGARYDADDDLDEYLRRPLKAAGPSGRVATYFGTRFSEQKGFVQVSGIVLTVASVADARRVSSTTVKARDALLRRAGPDDWTVVSLPRYGDQQRARVSAPGNEGIANAELIVRKRAAVWLLYVTLERRPKPPVSELVTDVKLLGTTQQRPVGLG